MKRIVFNVATPLGVLLVGCGIGLEFGIGNGLTAAGVLVLGLTLYFARIAGVKG